MLTSDVDYIDTWKAMENLVDEGLVKSIGVSNYNITQLERLLSVARIKPLAIQIELHPYFTRDKLVQYCQDKGITVVAYSPFGAPDREFKNEVKDPCVLLQDPVVAAIAKKHGRTSAQVLLRYHIQRGIAVIPKSVTPARIVENAKVFDFQLDKEDYDQLAGLNKNWSIRPASMVAKLQKHKYFPKSDD
uniref:aldo-keto reductase family 1 member B1-like n=1 Tax=Myxine glutinosa TaxID=7769 RepID=UPI0035902F7B